MRFVWCTLAALAGTSTHDHLQRAVVSVESLVRPTAHLPDFHSAASSAHFSFGAMPAAALSHKFNLAPDEAVAAAAALHSAAFAASALRTALLNDVSPAAADMALWAERIQPIDTSELPPALMASLQSYNDPKLALL
eukprot:6057725-Pleurochrysis_carterae.AAC.1